MGRLVFVLLAALLVASGCTRSNDPLLVNDTRGDANAPAPMALGGMVEISDDFEAGLDPAVWYREFINGVSWVHGVEAGSGYIYSPPQQAIDVNNRPYWPLYWPYLLVAFTPSLPLASMLHTSVYWPRFGESCTTVKAK